MDRLKTLGNQVRHLRARIAGHRLRQDRELDVELALFHRETADALAICLPDILDAIEAAERAAAK